MKAFRPLGNWLIRLKADSENARSLCEARANAARIQGVILNAADIAKRTLGRATSL